MTKTRTIPTSYAADTRAKGRRLKWFLRELRNTNVKFVLRNGYIATKKNRYLGPIEALAIKKGFKVSKKWDGTRRVWYCAGFLNLEMWTVVGIITSCSGKRLTVEKHKKSMKFRRLLLKYLNIVE